LDSWEKGKKFLSTLGKKTNISITEQEEYLLLKSENIDITVFFDLRGFSFITCKIMDDSFEPIVLETKESFEKQ